jgi:hypothetical protein
LGNHIGELNEKSLHAALKAWYAQPDDRLEVSVDGYVIDIVRQDTLIEIQTGNFTALKDKLYDLTERHPVRLVYPMAREKWILKLDPKGLEQASRRKSPRRGKLQDLFYELVRIPDLVSREHFSLEVLWIKEEEVRRYEAGRCRSAACWRWLANSFSTHRPIWGLCCPPTWMSPSPPGSCTMSWGDRSAWLARWLTA